MCLTMVATPHNTNFIQTSYYKLGNVCVSVCVCVCVSVCLCVCLSVRLYVSKFLNGSSPNFEGTLYGSWHVSWAIYVCVLDARACVHSLIFERILSKFAGNIIWLTLSGKDYVLFIFTHRAYACERAWLNVCLFMDGFSSNLRWTYYTLQPVAWATYFSSSRTVRTRASARVWARVVKTLTNLWMDSLKNVLGTYYKWPHVTWYTYLSCSCVAGTRARARVRASAWSFLICGEHTTNHNN
jgi:hypothetical protein